MSYEAHLLGRAEDLAEVSDLAELVTDVLAHVRAARVDTAATTSLAGAALILGESTITVYHAGDGASAFTSDIEFLDAVSAAEDEITDRLRAATRLQAQVSAALVAARAALLTAQAMPARTSEQQEARQAAIAAAQQRIALCEAAHEVLEELTGQVRQALAKLRAVPVDLGETYEPVYELRHAGRVMPKDGDFIEGASAHLHPDGVPPDAYPHPHPATGAAAPGTAPALGGAHPVPLSVPAPGPAHPVSHG